MPPEVPFFSFAGAPDTLKQAWTAAQARVIDDGVFIGGPHVAAFEAEYAAYCQARECVGVGNGLDALTLALRSLGIGPGHRVAVPGHTFIATWLAVLAVGAEPIGIDVDARGLIDLDALAAVSPAPDAVIPVHMHGQLVDMRTLSAWASAGAVIVVEDCAQSHGATGDDWRMGELSDAAAFSFYPSKNLGCLGDGGAIITSDEAVAERARELRSYGADPADKYRHVSIGVNSRLDPLQAAVLSVNLRHLDDWNLRRRTIADAYLQALAASRGSVRPLVPSADASVWHHFVVTTPHREAFRKAAAEHGIGTDVHYPHMAGDEIARLRGLPPSALPASAQLARTVVSLPLHPWLSDDDVTRVVEFLQPG